MSQEINDLLRRYVDDFNLTVVPAIADLQSRWQRVFPDLGGYDLPPDLASEMDSITDKMNNLFTSMFISEE